MTLILILKPRSLFFLICAYLVTFSFGQFRNPTRKPTARPTNRPISLPTYSPTTTTTSFSGYNQLIQTTDCNLFNGTCSPNYCSRVSNEGCTPSVDTVNVQGILNTLSCCSCTQTTTLNRYTFAYLDKYLKTTGGLKAAYCNDNYFVVIGDNSPNHGMRIPLLDSSTCCMDFPSFSNSIT